MILGTVRCLLGSRTHMPFKGSDAYTVNVQRASVIQPIWCLGFGRIVMCGSDSVRFDFSISERKLEAVCIIVIGAGGFRCAMCPAMQTAEMNNRSDLLGVLTHNYKTAMIQALYWDGADLVRHMPRAVHMRERDCHTLRTQKLILGVAFQICPQMLESRSLSKSKACPGHLFVAKPSHI